MTTSTVQLAYPYYKYNADKDVYNKCTGSTCEG